MKDSKVKSNVISDEAEATFTEFANLEAIKEMAKVQAVIPYATAQKAGCADYLEARLRENPTIIDRNLKGENFVDGWVAGNMALVFGLGNGTTFGLIRLH